MKKKVSVFLVLSALLLECSPWGAVLHFATPEKTIRETYSYFSLLPFGYANVAPFLTAILTVLLLAALFIFLLCKKGERLCFCLAVFAAVVSYLPLLFGIRYYSFVGGGISLLLTVSAVLLWRRKEKE